MDVLTREQRTRNMQAIRNKATKAELLLSKKLWSLGYRYRKNDKTVLGKPDLTLKRLRIAIFVDSEYFHGRNWETTKHRIKTNREFWWKKIESNIIRDNFVTNELLSSGWTVLRFWDTEIKKNLNGCTEIIERTIYERESAN